MYRGLANWIRQMAAYEVERRQIRVATDFSPHALAAITQTGWLAGRTGAGIALAHTLPDLQRAAYSSYKASPDLLYGKGDRLQREIRLKSDRKMLRLLLNLNAIDLDVKFKAVLAAAFVEIAQVVQQDGKVLRVVGRGVNEILRNSAVNRLVN